MYLSIGGDMAVREKSIIGIFDLDNCTYEKRTREVLAAAERNGEIITAAEDLPKSFLVTSEYGMTKVFLSQFTPATLMHRIGEKRV